MSLMRMTVVVLVMAVAACSGDDIPTGVFASATGDVGGGSCSTAADVEFSVQVVATGDTPDIVASRPFGVAWFCASQLSTDPPAVVSAVDSGESYEFACSSPRGEHIAVSVDHDLGGGAVTLSRDDGCAGDLVLGEVSAVYCDDIVVCGDALACGSCE